MTKTAQWACRAALLVLLGTVTFVHAGEDAKKEKTPAPPPESGKDAPATPKEPEPIPAPPDLAAPPEDAKKSDSGLAYRVLAPGSGTRHPVVTDLVSVHYTGWMSDGRMLDSSVQRGKPLTMVVKRFIPGWQEAVQAMVVGEKRRLWIPENLAFQKNPTAPPGMVVYDMELLEIKPGPDVPPPDVAGPPEGVEKTKSGIASKVLKAGHGTRHPSAASSVTVQYTGWTTDGKMFDSTLLRGAPASFSLKDVIRGWTEGLQLMVEGETRRMWIPDKLAYKGHEGKPQGMLVFDVELLAIQN